MPVSVTSSDDELIAELRAWLQLLAERKYVDALRRIPGEQGEAWTPQLLEEVIAGYGLPQSQPRDKRFEVTPVSVAKGALAVASVERNVVPPRALAYVEHSVPLNGEWSDLTATFVLYAHESEATLCLREVHVL